MVLIMDGSCSCVLLRSEKELHSECSTTTFPDIIERLNSMREHKEACDVFFAVGKEKKKFAAHRLILATSSDVFYRNFFGPLISRDGYSEENATIIPDVLPEAFEVLLQFCYSVHSKISKNVIVHSLYAAEKYNVEILRHACLHQLSSVSVNDCLSVLEQALYYDEMTIVDRCLKVIDENCDEIIASKDLRHCDEKTLLLIIGRDDFSPTSEFELFKEIVEFAKEQCEQKQLVCTGENLRKTLGDVLNLIRFPVMSHEDLLEVARENILSEEELDGLLRSVTDCSRPVSKFITCPRCSPGGTGKLTYSFKRVTAIEEVDWMCVGTTLFFQVDRDINLVCIGIYGYCDDEKLSMGDVSIMFASDGEDPERKIISKLYYDDKIVFLHLEEELELVAGQKYYLCVNLSNAEGRWLYRNSSHIGRATVTTSSGETVILSCEAKGGDGYFPYLRFTF